MQHLLFLFFFSFPFFINRSEYFVSRPPCGWNRTAAYFDHCAFHNEFYKYSMKNEIARTRFTIALYIIMY